MGNYGPKTLTQMTPVEVGHGILSLRSRREGDCLIFTGYLNRDGYGEVHDGRTYVGLAHRLTYTAVSGPVPEGLHLDHLCRVRACVNPDHLEPVTSLVNTMRGVGISARNAEKTCCVEGHLFNDANTYYRTRNGRTVRGCRACNRAAVKLYRQRKSEWSPQP